MIPFFPDISNPPLPCSVWAYNSPRPAPLPTRVKHHLLRYCLICYLKGSYSIIVFMMARVSMMLTKSGLVFCVSLLFFFFLLTYFPCVIQMYWSMSDWLGVKENTHPSPQTVWEAAVEELCEDDQVIYFPQHVYKARGIVCGFGDVHGGWYKIGNFN